MQTVVGDEGNQSQEGISTVPPPGHHWPVSTVTTSLMRQTVDTEGDRGKAHSSQGKASSGLLLRLCLVWGR